MFIKIQLLKTNTMNEIELQKLNESLYDDAKIYFKWGSRYSSKVLDRLMQDRSNTLTKSGCVYELTDKDNNTIAYGCGIIHFLLDLANKMR